MELPPGFRFRPTDAELVNHYLEEKIAGRIKSADEVISEIDICKSEPWDLPGDLPAPKSYLLPLLHCLIHLFVCDLWSVFVFPIFFGKN
ncbi:unnamed protein product [Musa acuminata subsp. malaccensis]|uniref:(wild Malaysian banana) hypothetical protein n=1 Tax=Musa acuminata subsp. malaccensis TaxID=214687 RepID=A0A804HMC1_MUSAM|nr:unnamed protein product [Musa acuminata subsp. malaccensis]